MTPQERINIIRAELNSNPTNLAYDENFDNDVRLLNEKPLIDNPEPAPQIHPELNLTALVSMLPRQEKANILGVEVTFSAWAKQIYDSSDPVYTEDLMLKLDAAVAQSAAPPDVTGQKSFMDVINDFINADLRPLLIDFAEVMEAAGLISLTSRLTIQGALQITIPDPEHPKLVAGPSRAETLGLDFVTLSEVQQAFSLDVLDIF